MLGARALRHRTIAKWPVLALIVIVIIALLYYTTPNVKQPKFTWVSPGALIPMEAALLASLALTFYVANFGSDNETYGSLPPRDTRTIDKDAQKDADDVEKARALRRSNGPLVYAHAHAEASSTR